ncbi:chaperonin 10-like protein [Penicillium brevicompactum]|uniref:Chaperonin 10-like protein n=1 Tax=Penicillium brevicompactum TaxID=5074 RepID=A0A9W9Q4H9_PENBR|nr:chaperonin 10-like protein [Penicillium brevicompactum]
MLSVKREVLTTPTHHEIKKPSSTHLEYRPERIKTEALVVMAAKQPFTMMPITLDEVRSDEYLIEMKYSGLCHTDLVLQQGLLPMIDFPAILGHEGSGIVRAIGADVKDKTIQVGNHVLLSFNACGACRQCESGHPAFCHIHPQVNHSGVRQSDQSTPACLADGTSVRSQYFGHSSFSRVSVVNENCVIKIDPRDPMDTYAPLGCGFQTGAGTILNVLKPGPRDTVVVFGLGSVGLTALMATASRGVHKIIAVDIQDSKLESSLDLGATETLNPKECPNVEQKIKEMTSGGADFAIDCTGNAAVIQATVECLAPGGTAAIVGVPPPNVKIEIDPLTFLLDNKTLTGIIEGDSVPKKTIPELIQLHRNGKFPIERLCKIYPVKDLDQALSDLKAGKVVKPVIQWD